MCIIIFYLKISHFHTSQPKMRTYLLVIMFAFTSLEIFAQKNKKDKKDDTAISTDDTLSKYRPKYDYRREVYTGEVTIITPPKKIETADNDYAYNFDITDKLSMGTAATAYEKTVIRIQKSGFRIQVYLGTDRQEATQARQKCFGSFAEYHPYLEFSRPTYRVRLGDFEYRESARQVWLKVKRRFPTASIIPDMVWVTKIANQDELMLLQRRKAEERYNKGR